LSDCRNVDSLQLESLSWCGSKFQTVGPATENAQQLSVLCQWHGTASKQWCAECRSLPDTVGLCCGDIGGL